MFQENYYKEKDLEPWKIPLEEIHLATKKFHNRHLIGGGGFGGVYKGELFHLDVRKYIGKKESHRLSMVGPSGYPRRRSKVAIKKLDGRYGQGRKEFLQEIEVLSCLKHQNLVSLLGFCDEDDNMILVYEHAFNGSLDKCINNRRVYSHKWAQRLQICLDIAHGLSYLHNLDIIHRDIKSANILLGRNLEGIIGDFGLSRISKHKNLEFSKTNVAGTPAYICPKYFRTGKLSKRSDIYSFGVVLWEVLCGRLARLPQIGDDQEYLIHLAKRHFKEDKLKLIIDPHLKEEFEKSCSSPDKNNIQDSIDTFAAIAYECVDDDETKLLTMADVVKQLKKAWTFHVAGVEMYSLKVINSATLSFSKEHVIGKGASGIVYTGELMLSMGPIVVAVKRLHKHNVGSYEEGGFFKEVAMLSSYVHENVVSLQGFCEEENEMILVFAHAFNGSLNNHLDNSSLTWGHRLKISIGAAHGLHYIHKCVEPQRTVHGDIKSSHILLDHNWKATISDLVTSKNHGTLGYINPLYSSGGITKESDVYAFGVVLFEILSGRLAIEKVEKYPPNTLCQIIEVKPGVDGREDKDEQVVYLDQLASRCFENNKLETIIFDKLKGKTDTKSIDTFSEIAYQCLQKDPKKRPTMAQVIEALQKALAIHDEWEWEQKLPRDYEKTIKMSKYSTLSMTFRKKDLYSFLSSGIPLENGTLWFSLSKDGNVNEMISATKFSYKNLRSFKWRSRRKSRFSRFPKVAKMSDTSNLNIQIKIETQFLSVGITYGVYLVFKFWDPRMVLSEPYVNVNLKYRTRNGNINAYIAEWRDDEWMMIELYRFRNHNQLTYFEVLLKSFCGRSCGSGAIFVEGIEFRAIDDVDHEENVLLNTESKMEHDQQWLAEFKEIMKRSQYDISTLTKQELFLLLSNGILLDDGEKVFSLSKVNQKKCHMLPAKAIIYNSSHVRCSDLQPRSNSRFAEVIELQSHQVIHIKCNIETQLLSPDTAYECYLVFELPENRMGFKYPVKAYTNKNKYKVLYFRSPWPVDLHRDKRVPRQREDGWMEVIVWDFMAHKDLNTDYLPMYLKLVCLDGTMSGLIICGIEFRPKYNNVIKI